MPDPDAIRVKICGIRDDVGLKAAISSGASYIGFVFFEKSPRYVTPAEAAVLSAAVSPGICKVALVVDADNETLDTLTRTVGLDMLQLHGEESPERVAEIRARYGLPVMKAIGISTANDLPAIETYARVADQLLIDAKPTPGADLPGGNGLPFDWSLLAGRRWPVPWILAGGLTPQNVDEAIYRTGARQLDVSSGVEASRGVKDPAKVAAFVQAARTAVAPAKSTA